MDSHLGIADSILYLLIHSLKKGRNHMLFVLYARCARIQQVWLKLNNLTTQQWWTQVDY